MSDTFGGLIDKLITIDMKMWNNQELIYEIRRMTFDEYKQKYFTSEDGAQNLWESLKKACIDNNLIYTKMSSVNSGKLNQYKGWTVKPLNME